MCCESEVNSLCSSEVSAARSTHPYPRLKFVQRIYRHFPTPFHIFLHLIYYLHREPDFNRPHQKYLSLDFVHSIFSSPLSESMGVQTPAAEYLRSEFSLLALHKQSEFRNLSIMR
ncbi:unnamed protein product [Cuscuta europaea]|uniref:Uncharacterized protein n=1 Tax=Cuscuta europaea TaxID=41803 RepID=A0A9P0ZWV2_CUSEU|nr:unnamed protein product [Cuscuta europaea]